MPTLYDKLTSQRYDLTTLVKKHGNELTIGRKKSVFQIFEKQPLIALGTNYRGQDTLASEYKNTHGLSINHAKIVYNKEMGIFSIIKNKSSRMIAILRKNYEAGDKTILLPHIKENKIIMQETLTDNDEIMFGIYGPVIYKIEDFA
ncbi:MAG: hypothetical protein KJ646_05550 [Nanoarchaeota archaeon]|nr:hypothetical protein [Nanoarchaeota archaeon]